jgi:hypothetical protein
MAMMIDGDFPAASCGSPATKNYGYGWPSTQSHQGRAGSVTFDTKGSPRIKMQQHVYGDCASQGATVNQKSQHVDEQL